MDNNNNENFNGKISICRRTGGEEGSSISITIEDKNHIQFFDGTMTIENFGNAISGLGGIPIKCTLRGIDNVNKTLEQKKVKFTMPPSFVESYNRDTRIKIAKSIVVTEEVDGWKADLSQINNHHYYSQNETEITIKFYRYV